MSETGETARWVGPHHAGSCSGSSSADHHVGDVAGPVFLALLVGQQGQGSLLQVVGSTGSCGRQSTRNTQTHFLLPFQDKSILILNHFDHKDLFDEQRSSFDKYRSDVVQRQTSNCLLDYQSVKESGIGQRGSFWMIYSTCLSQECCLLLFSG